MSHATIVSSGAANGLFSSFYFSWPSYGAGGAVR